MNILYSVGNFMAGTRFTPPPPGRAGLFGLEAVEIASKANTCERACNMCNSSELP